jgi:CysZ protein
MAVRRFLSGFASPFGGASFILRHPSLWRYVLVPLAINGMLFAALFFSLGIWAKNLIDRFVPATGIAHVLLMYPAYVLGAFVVLLVCALAATILGNVLALPFNTLLCARVTEIATGQPFAPGGLAQSLGELPGDLLDQVKKWALWLLCMLVLLFLHLVPVAGSVLWSVLSILVTAWFFGLEYLEYPLTTRRARFRAKIEYAWGNLSLALGLGAWVFLTLPLLGWVTMPLCVAGATLAFFDDPAAREVGP